MPQNRDKTGRLSKGQRGAKASKPKELHNYAQQAPTNLRAIADDPDTPVKVKTEIEKWFYEAVYGKATQAVELETGPIDIRALDLSKLSDEELAKLADEAEATEPLCADRMDRSEGEHRAARPGDQPESEGSRALHIGEA